MVNLASAALGSVQTPEALNFGGIGVLVGVFVGVLVGVLVTVLVGVFDGV
jgi:hypothetical protein